MQTLFQPLQVGALKLPNRILMAPLERNMFTRKATTFYHQLERTIKA